MNHAAANDNTLIDITPGMDGYRLWFRDQVIAHTRTATTALRLATKIRQAMGWSK